MPIKDTIKKHRGLEKLARRMLAVMPSSLKLGADFWRWLSFFEESEGWSKEDLSEYQLQCLKELLRRLKANSPYYRERLAGLDIDRLSSLEQFRAAVPILSRQEFAENSGKIRSTDWSKSKVSKASTSGTTGSALTFYNSAIDNQREFAAICHQWKRVGYMPGVSRRAEFRGLTAHDQPVQEFPEHDMIRCSIIQMQPPHLRLYAEAIKKHKIDFYHGYPSALSLLATHIANEKIRFPQPRAILLASEAVHEWQLQRISEVFPNARIFAHYGCAERVALAGWCERRREYHVLPQYSLVEIEEQTHQIIGTNLFNSINGFVRYRLSDTVLESSFDECPDCGRAYWPRLISLGGRMEDYLFSPDNGWVPPAIVTYPLKSLCAISEIQFWQDEKDRIVLRYTAPETIAGTSLAAELRTIESDMRHILGKSIRLLFQRVDSFPKDGSGKFKWIVCKLDEHEKLKDVKTASPSSTSYPLAEQ